MKGRESAAERATRRDWFGLETFRPGPRFLRAGARCYLLEEVGSTSDFLLGRGAAAVGRRADWDGWGWRAQSLQRLSPVDDPRVGDLVASRRQTAGRGRLGRRWFDCGGLQVSSVVPNRRADFVHGFSVWLGLMVVWSLREDHELDAMLKWPNDVLVGGRKLGGLLVDRVGGEERGLVVAGLGLNLSAGPADFPAELQGRTTSMRLETGRVPRPAEVIGPILRTIDRWLGTFAHRGWGPFRTLLADCDVLAGRWVALDVAGGRVTGKVAGIDHQGALVVAVGGSERRYHAGEVHLVAQPVDSSGTDRS
ncbi:MAG: biotin--[acetyl-CoA-carboxylase] ligase [Candidatus Krumholzibacteriia bacterium]